jgi:hypothetical protein
MNSPWEESNRHYRLSVTDCCKQEEKCHPCGAPAIPTENWPIRLDKPPADTYTHLGIALREDPVGLNKGRRHYA